MEKNKGLFSVRKHLVGNFSDRKKGRKRKGGRLRQGLAMLLAVALVGGTLPASGLTVSASGREVGICKHHQEHDADCGYIPKSEDGEGSPCTYECRICPVEDLIAALPDKGTKRNEFRLDNAEDVRAQLEEILALYGELNEDEQEQIDLSQCYALQEAMDNANAPMTAAETIDVSSSFQKKILTAEAGGCPGHTFTGTAQAAMIYVESGAHDVTFSDLKIIAAAQVGVAPNATMNLTIDGTNKIQADVSFAGIYVPVGATLVINGAGSLDVSGSGHGAGIGGATYAPDENESDGNPNCGTVVINGGTITATGGGTNSASAGIGGGITDDVPGNGGDITINGGTVTATGGSDGYLGGAGIGGGGGVQDYIYGGTFSGCGGSLTINGGHVTLASGQYNPQDGIAYGFGAGSGDVSGGTCELTLADASYLTADSLDPNGKYTIKSALTADMISVPLDMHYTSADMAAEIKGKVTLAGKVAVCGRDFTVDTSGWTLDIAKVSDMEYTATYTHADKETISKTVTILPCIHNNGAALTHHDRVEADCTHTGILEYWDCSICGKNFSDKDGKTEITDTELPIAAHTLTHHDRVEADCTQAGTLEYWECSVCKKIFSDKDGQTEITEINIPITAHTLTHHEGQEATCTAAGSREYWDCSVCGKKFSDQNGQTEIADADIVIAAKPHTLTHHAEEAGCLTEGTIEYWSCSVCSKLFADADGKKEITDIKLSAQGHQYGAWGSNGNGMHTHSCQRGGCDFTETENCSGGTATYMEKAKCTVCGVEYGELLKDVDAPTGEISIGTNKWNNFLNTITFGLFFKETEQVTITAQDNESGVASVSYYISDSKLTKEEVKKLENWTAGNTDKTTFRISSDKSCVVYAKITDKQENVTYISSDGLVFDGTSPSITGVTDGKTYCTSQEVTVTDNNSESVTVTVNGKEQTLSDSKFTLEVKFDTTPMIITATDKAGNTATVTVNAGHDYGKDWKSGSNGHWQECVVCGNNSEVLAHTEDSGTVTKPATQTETGIRTYKCSVCGYEMRTEEIGKLPPVPTGTPLPTGEPVPTATPEPTPTGTPVQTEKPLPTVTPEPTPTGTPGQTEKPLPTVTPEPTPTGTPGQTEKPLPTVTPEPTPTGTPVQMEKPLPTVTPEPTPTVTPVQTEKPLPTVTPEPMPTVTPVQTEKPLPTVTPEPTPTVTPVQTEKPLPTEMPVPTVTPLPTEAPLPLPTATPGQTEKPFPTATPLPVPSETPVQTGETVMPEEVRETSAKLDSGISIKWRGNAIALKWKKTEEADGYDVFATRSGKKLDGKSLVKTVENGKTSVSLTKIDGKKLSGKKVYSVKIKAWKYVEGKKTYTGESRTYHIAGRDNKKYTNAKKLKPGKKKYTLKKGRSARIQVTVSKEAAKKKLLPKSYGPALRYWSGNEKIATVTQGGRVKAGKKGSCYIYATALNGVRTRIKITVK